MKKKTSFVYLLYIALSFLMVITYFIISGMIFSPSLKQIHLSELEEIQYKESTCIVYIGRTDCKDCTIAYPKIKDLSEKHNIKILYYDTAEDRYSNSDQLHNVLDTYKITQVPTILIVDKGIIIKKFDYGNVVDIFINYLKTKGVA